MMHASSSCFNMVKGFEGLSLKTYRCPSKVLTNGWGHTGPDVIEGQIITLERAEYQLGHDILLCEKVVNELVTVPLTQNQFDALVCFIFNIGAYAFRKSTLLKKLNVKDYTGAANEFLKWDKAGIPPHLVVEPGLEKRRKAEKELFLS